MNKMKTLIGNRFSFPKGCLVRSVGVALFALLVWPVSTPGALTLNLDINTGSSPTYSGTAIAPDAGNYWNSFVTPAASSLTLTSVRDSANNLITSTITISRNGGANFNVWDNSGGGGNPNPVGLMRDYLYGATHTITVSNLPAGLYHLFAYAHGDNTGQASTVTVNAANGGGSGTTSDVGEYRNIYQAGAQGSAYVKLPGTVGAAGTFIFTAGNYVNGFQLQQLSAPVISGLTNQTVIAGTTAVLSPTSTGTPPPTFQWRSNSVTLAGATNASLVLNNVQHGQNGTVYSLVATNPAGAATNSMTLTVIVTPAITGLVNQAAPVGSDVTLAATVSGVPTPALQWRKNGTNLVGATSASYFIANAQATDSGTYSLVASNAAGIVTNSATLTVSAGDVASGIVGPMDQTVVQSSNATFITSASGLPLPTLQWRLNGAEIPGQTNSSLTVSNVQYSQNGHVYSVIASNVAGLATNSATLFVLVPSAISQQPTNLSVIVGSPAIFSVGASGVPTVKYQWRKNGSPLANATNASYIIANAQGADNGAVFSVVVSNSVGVVTSSNATLTVLSTMTGAFLPTNNATGISPDQQLRIVFSSTPKLGAGKLYVRDAATHAIFATIDTSIFQTFTMFGATVTNAVVRTVQGANYYYMPIGIYGNEAWITLPATNRFAYNKTYYVNTDDGLFRDAANASVPAISGTNTWRFSTKPSGPATPTASTGLTNLTVAHDGAGDFATLQGAADWVPQNNTLKRTITIQPGVYRDNTTFAQNRNNVTIIGAGANRQAVQLFYPYPAFASGSGAGTLRLESSTIYVRNLTIDNAVYLNYNGVTFAGPIQTVITTGNRLIFDNVLIKGGQDTLYTISGIAYFNRCEIWGSVDFIYGAALAVFDQCDIVEIRDSGGPITAPNTALAAPYGMVFLNCDFPRALTANGYPYNVGTGNTTFQRPWRQDGYTAIINCALGSQMSTKGWAEWGNRHTTCRAREAGTTLIGGGTVDLTSRTNAGAFWLNTIDPDYVNDPTIDPDVDPEMSLLILPNGPTNRVGVTINTNDFTLDAIFGHSYYGLGSWRPTTLPTITMQPTNRTASAGSEAAFAVAALGQPAPSFQWRKNGTNIVGATSSTFTIASAKLADNGTYSAIVSNSAGTISSSNAVLTIPAVPAPITPTFTNGALNLSWPADRIGFRLEAQTNSLGTGLSTSWFTVVGSSATNQMSLPINPANGSVFLRLTYP
jgi:pectin methylesterase-like acyl-CoA thioesterase